MWVVSDEIYESNACQICFFWLMMTVVVFVFFFRCQFRTSECPFTICLRAHARARFIKPAYLSFSYFFGLKKKYISFSSLVDRSWHNLRRLMCDPYAVPYSGTSDRCHVLTCYICHLIVEIGMVYTRDLPFRCFPSPFQPNRHTHTHIIHRKVQLQSDIYPIFVVDCFFHSRYWQKNQLSRGSRCSHADGHSGGGTQTIKSIFGQMWNNVDMASRYDHYFHNIDSCERVIGQSQ